MPYSSSHAASRSPSKAARAYAQIGIQTRVGSASPERLISLLFEGALLSISKARLHLANKAIAARGEAIFKAIDIIQRGLIASLNHEAGGEISANLNELYRYMVRELMNAHRNADDQALQAVHDLLLQLAQAWRASVDPAASKIS
jgi:flagellar protein FliS